MNGSEFESRLEDIVRQLQSRFGDCRDYPIRGGVVEEIVLGILGRDTGERQSSEAYERLCGAVVDFNELRVASPDEIVETLGKTFPDAAGKGRDMVAALNDIYEKLETLDLSEFKDRPKREAEKWLSAVPGVDPYTCARVMLLCFGAHHVPLSLAALAWLQHHGLFEQGVSPADAQGVLERHVRATEALGVFCLLQRLADEPAPPAPTSRTASRSGGQSRSRSKATSRGKASKAASKSSSSAKTARKASAGKKASKAGTSRSSKTSRKSKKAPARREAK